MLCSLPKEKAQATIGVGTVLMLSNTETMKESAQINAIEKERGS
jgi:hypothetical protein